MQILKKRGVAILIAVVVICLATILSVHRSLGAKCAAVGALPGAFVACGVCLAGAGAFAVCATGA